MSAFPFSEFLLQVYPSHRPPCALARIGTEKEAWLRTVCATLCVESFGPVWCENALVHAHEVRGVAIVCQVAAVSFAFPVRGHV